MELEKKVKFEDLKMEDRRNISNSFYEEYSPKLKKLGYTFAGVSVNEGSLSLHVEYDSWLRKLRFVEKYLEIKGSKKKREELTDLFKEGYSHSDLHFEVEVGFQLYSRLL